MLAPREVPQIEAQRLQQLGARALHEIEIVAMVDDAPRIGVLVVDAYRPGKVLRVHYDTRGYLPSCSPGSGAVSAMLKRPLIHPRTARRYPIAAARPGRSAGRPAASPPGRGACAARNPARSEER